jgi:hypothetical protein
VQSYKKFYSRNMLGKIILLAVEEKVYCTAS